MGKGRKISERDEKKTANHEKIERGRDYEIRANDDLRKIVKRKKERKKWKQRFIKKRKKEIGKEIKKNKQRKTINI